MDRSHACILREWAAAPGHLASALAGTRERLVVVVGAACASAGSEHGVVRGADNDIQAEGAVALAAALQGNTTLQTLDFSSTWTARTRAFCGKGRPLPGHLASARIGRRERLVVVVGAACASAGSEHGVVRGAGNWIRSEGAVALAAALQGNTTLQTLDLSCTWTARTRAFCGNERPLPGTSRVRGRRGRERLVVVVGAACASASAGSAHGVVRGADNSIHAEGAVALAAALQGNTTLQTLALVGMWTARTRAFCGNR